MDRSYVYVVIPQPPEGVTNRQQLMDYLIQHHKTAGRQFHEDLGTAIVFGCGR
jgi:hypothetical protein